MQPYWGKLTVRNDRGDRGNVGIIRSPIRASILPDHLIEDPEWWFSTVATAFFVNIVSALVYDKLKQWVKSEGFLVVCHVVFAGIVFASFLLVQPDDYYARNVLPVIGAFIALSILSDVYYLKQRFRYIAPVTTVAVFAVSVIWESYNSSPSYTIKWFATQFFCAFGVAVGISFLTVSFLRIRGRKAKGQR